MLNSKCECLSLEKHTLRREAKYYEAIQKAFDPEQVEELLDKGKRQTRKSLDARLNLIPRPSRGISYAGKALCSSRTPKTCKYDLSVAVGSLSKKHVDRK